MTDKQPPPGLDAAVHRALGKPVRVGRHGHYYTDQIGLVGPIPVPPYSTDAGAAMTALEAFVAALNDRDGGRWYACVSSWPPIWELDESRRWNCELSRTSTSCDVSGPCGTGTTAAEAICRTIIASAQGETS